MLSTSTILLGLLAVPALAQTSTSLSIPTSLIPTLTGTAATAATPAGTGTSATGGTSSNDNLPALVAQFPQCAVRCLTTASTDIGCNGPADFGCLCNSGSKLTTSIGLCIVTAGCSSDDISKASSLAPQICLAWGANRQNPAALASGTSAVSSLASVAGVTSTTAPGAVAKTGAPIAAVLGAAGAWAVMAL